MSARPAASARSAALDATIVAVALARRLAGCGGPMLANPPAAHPRVTAGPAGTPRPPDPQPGRPARATTRPRPPDRVVVLHGPPPRRDRRPLGLRVRRVPRGARRLPGDLGVAPGAHRRDRRPVPLRPAGGDRAAGGLARRGRAGDRRASRFARPRPRPAGPRVAHARAVDDGRRPAARTGSRPRPARRSRSAIPSGGFGLALDLPRPKPAALHDGDGYIDFGPAGGSYYYSRTAMTATGHASRVGDRTLTVDGSAWFDHQWGDFISVGAGGWDWFAVNLADGTDITLSLVRAADGVVSRWSTGRSWTRTGSGAAASAPRRLHGRGDRPLDEPGDRGRRTRPAGRSRSRATGWWCGWRRRSRSRSWTPARRRASSTGRARSG